VKSDMALEKRIQTHMAQGRSTNIIQMLKWIRTSRVSINESLSLCRAGERVRLGTLTMALTQRVGGSVRKVDIRLHGKGNSNSHGARPVY